MYPLKGGTHVTACSRILALLAPASVPRSVLTVSSQDRNSWDTKSKIVIVFRAGSERPAATDRRTGPELKNVGDCTMSLALPMRDTRVVTVLLLDALGELNGTPGQPQCRRRATSNPASAHDKAWRTSTARPVRLDSLHGKTNRCWAKIAHFLLRNRPVLAYAFL